MNTPNGMRAVTQEEFFAALKADPRDIMPSLAYSTTYTVWETRDRAEWGRTFPGWRNPGDDPAYFLKAAK
jgi:hypothetical protein